MIKKAVKKSIINQTGKHGSNKIYLHLSEPLSYLLKKHLKYATFNFVYDSKELAISDFNAILKDLNNAGIDTTGHEFKTDLI